MESVLYYTARVTFVLLSLYGLFLIGASIVQLIWVAALSERLRFTPFVLVQLLHGTLSLIVGLFLNFQLEATFFSSLTLLVLSWAYMAVEYFGRRWYTVRLAVK